MDRMQAQLLQISNNSFCHLERPRIGPTRSEAVPQATTRTATVMTPRHAREAQEGIKVKALTDRWLVRLEIVPRMLWLPLNQSLASVALTMQRNDVQINCSLRSSSSRKRSICRSTSMRLRPSLNLKTTTAMIVSLTRCIQET